MASSKLNHHPQPRDGQQNSRISATHTGNVTTKVTLARLPILPSTSKPKPTENERATNVRKLTEAFDNMIAEQQPLLRRRGSSQMSDREMQTSRERLPSPVREGRHMMPRYIPFDLEAIEKGEANRQGSIRSDTYNDTEDIPSKRPRGWGLHCDGYFSRLQQQYSTQEFAEQKGKAISYYLLQLTLWLGIGIMIAITLLFQTGIGPFKLSRKYVREHQVGLAWIHNFIKFLWAIACYQLVSFGAREIMWAFERPRSRTWMCAYNVLPPVIALGVAVYCGAADLRR